MTASGPIGDSTRDESRPMIQAGSSTKKLTKTSNRPRVARKREMRAALQPCWRLAAANRLMPTPIRKKKPGAQKWVTKRVRNAIGLA